MKKRSSLAVLTILCLALAFLTAIGLGACVKDEPTNAGPFTESVSSAADMEKLRSHLGAYYDQGVFELTNDIFIDGDWSPIGTSVTESFRGTLDGKGHTITYTIDLETPDKTDTSALATSSSYGLFGYLAGATVKNLNIVVNVKVPVEAEILYAGGLAGFIYGDTLVENVTVSGSVTVSVSNILNESIADIYASEMNASIGGVFGYAIGNVTLKNVSSSADVTAAAYRLLGTATLDTVQRNAENRGYFHDFRRGSEARKRFARQREQRFLVRKSGGVGCVCQCGRYIRTDSQDSRRKSLLYGYSFGVFRIQDQRGRYSRYRGHGRLFLPR